MKALKASTLSSLNPLLDVLRAHPALREVRPAEFALDGKDFVHFHEDSDGVFADVRFALLAGVMDQEKHHATSRGAHVWVSVKQAASRRPEHWLTEEGSGAAAAAWSSSHRNAAVCDGTWQVGTFTIDQVEFGQGQLEPGQGWVQFCVIPADAPDESVITWSMRFAAVK